MSNTPQKTHVLEATECFPLLPGVALLQKESLSSIDTLYLFLNNATSPLSRANSRKSLTHYNNHKNEPI